MLSLQTYRYLQLAIERKSKKLKSWQAKPISKISAIIPWQNFLKATKHQQFPLNIYRAVQKIDFRLQC